MVDVARAIPGSLTGTIHAEADEAGSAPVLALRDALDRTGGPARVERLPDRRRDRVGDAPRWSLPRDDPCGLHVGGPGLGAAVPPSGHLPGRARRRITERPSHARSGPRRLRRQERRAAARRIPRRSATLTVRIRRSSRLAASATRKVGTFLACQRSTRFVPPFSRTLLAKTSVRCRSRNRLAAPS